MEENAQDNRTDAEQLTIENGAQRIAEYLQGMPPVNIGALFLPPVWGPAKGIWATILWYPLWVFADNCLFAWWSQGTPLATTVGVLTLIILFAATIAFAYYSAPIAAYRAIQKGKTKEEFQHAEHIWAVCSVIGGLLILGLATYYNLYIRAAIPA
jgi:hypothetical protein